MAAVFAVLHREARLNEYICSGHVLALLAPMSIPHGDGIGRCSCSKRCKERPNGSGPLVEPWRKGEYRKLERTVLVLAVPLPRTTLELTTARFHWVSLLRRGRDE